MSSTSYSFLDVAVLDAVRQRFAGGDALAVLSSDLEQVIWANGPGAAALGYTDIEAAIGASAGLPPVARRQIMATSGFPEIGADRAISVRLAAGMISRAVTFLASSIAMPDGERAILLAVPAAQAGSRSTSEIAIRAIGGFTQDGQFLAFVDGEGGIEAATRGFSALGIARETLVALAADLAGESERVIKRLVRAGEKSYPAGLARLSDDPARHLLVVIDEGHAEEAEAAQPASAAEPVAQEKALDGGSQSVEERASNQKETAAVLDPASGTGEPSTAETGRTASAESPQHHDSWYFSDHEKEAPSVPHEEIEQGEPEHEPRSGHKPPQEPASFGTSTSEPTPRTTGAISEKRPETPAPAADVAAAPVQRREPRIDRNAPPLRFVWRTDADGQFSAISPEFAEIVGAPAADVIGRRFGDVGAAFGLDPGDEIAGLLDRRDTWSGRTVLWPIAGTDLKIPVDLAALPVYGRSRAFEGFRGFGVARAADAVADPEGIGLALVPNGKPSDEAVPVEPSAEDGKAVDPDVAAADPFKGEVPVLTIVPKQERRFTDKVIRLAEHRQPANNKGLSILERSAFREIGEKLKKDSAPETAGPATDAPTARDAAGQQAGAANDRIGTVAPHHPTGGPPSAPSAQFEASGQDNREPSIRTPQGESRDADRPAGSQVGAAEPAAGNEASDAAMRGEAGATPAGTHPSAEEPAERSLLGPATRPGLLAGGGPLMEDTGRPDAVPTQIEDDDSADLAVIADAENVDDLGRLDSASPEEIASGEASARDDSIATADFADARDDETLPTSLDLDEAGRPGGDDDNARPEDDGVPTPAGEDRSEPASVIEDRKPAAAETGTAETAPERPAEPPRQPAPPLQTTGFAPSAFASAESGRDAPDTSLLAKLPVPLLIHSGDDLHYANEEFFGLTGYGSLDALAEAGGLDALFAEPYGDDSAADSGNRALRMKARDGREFPVDALLRSVPWRGGKALMLVLRRSSEAGADRAAQGASPESGSSEFVQPDVSELKARIAEMRTIIDTATDGVVLIGRDGAIRSISRPAEALFGFDSDDVAGTPFASLFAIESQRAARDYLAGLSEPGVASVLNDGREVIGREAQGRFIPLFMTIGRLPGDSGYCAVVRDITQWKRAEEDLTQARAVAERASSQKTDFLARISHEIRTPLNAIIGFSELMVDEKFGPVANDRYRDYLRDINRSGNHVLDLVNDLLDISKIEAGQQEMDYEAVSLNDTLAETVAMMQPQANRERVIIRSSLASSLPDVVADLRSVRQIALNILSNAVRYTQAGGQVIVSTAYEPSGDVVLRVRDTGVGMSQAEIEQALKPFKQINALKRGRGDGTGLGLPLTKAMVEANRAQFTIHSTPGEGTLVEIAFPSTRVLAD